MQPPYTVQRYIRQEQLCRTAYISGAPLYKIFHLWKQECYTLIVTGNYTAAQSKFDLPELLRKCSFNLQPSQLQRKSVSCGIKCICRVQPAKCEVSQFIYFCKVFYMFQTVFPSIIRSSKLHIQHQAFVRPLLLPAASSR